MLDYETIIHAQKLLEESLVDFDDLYGIIEIEGISYLVEAGKITGVEQ